MNSLTHFANSRKAFKMIPIVAVVGSSGSGKTTLIEYLVSHLTADGLNVGTLKHTHHADFSMDVEGKDTWRHAQAGAKVVICIAPNEIAMIKRGKTCFEKAEKILTLYRNENLDIIITEGFRSIMTKHSRVFKILIEKNGEKLRENLEEITAPVLAIIGPTTLRKFVPEKTAIPFFDRQNAAENVLKLIRSSVLCK